PEAPAHVAQDAGGERGPHDQNPDRRVANEPAGERQESATRPAEEWHQSSLGQPSPSPARRGPNVLEPAPPPIGSPARALELAGGSRIHLHPSLTRNPGLDPGVGIGLAHDVEAAPQIVLRSDAKPLDEAGRYTFETKKDDGGGCKILAVRGPLFEEKLGQRV